MYDEEVEYIETFDTDDLGIKFLPHSPEEPPFLKELGFGLAPGYHYLIGLKEKEVSVDVEGIYYVMPLVNFFIAVIVACYIEGVLLFCLKSNTKH